MGLTSACIYMYHYHGTKFYDIKKGTAVSNLACGYDNK